MADISKCEGNWEGKDCCLRETCYRYTAPASSIQSYLKPLNPGKNCEEYWHVKGEE